MLAANLECGGVRRSMLVEVFVGPCLIIGVVVGEVDSAVVVEIIFGVPVAQGQLRRDRAIVV